MDVIEFEAALDAASLGEKAGDYSTQKTCLEEALSLYRGEMIGVTVGSVPRSQVHGEWYFHKIHGTWTLSPPRKH